MIKIYLKGMLFRILFFFVMLLIHSNSFTQNREIDSLLGLIKISDNDSIIINVQLAISEILIKTDPVGAQEFADYALNISEKINYEHGEIKALKLLRKGYSFQKDYLKKYVINKKLEKIFRLKKDTIEIFNCVSERLKVQSGMGEFDSAKVSLTELKVLNITLKGKKQLEVINQSGNLFWIAGQIDSAEHYYKRLSKLSFLQQNIKYSNNASNNLAAIAFSKKDYLKAKNIYISILEYDEGYLPFRLENYNNLSSAYYYLGQDDSSTYYDYKCIEIAKKLNQQQSLFNFYSFMLERYKNKNIGDSIIHYTRLTGETKLELNNDNHSLNLKKLRIQEFFENTKRDRQIKEDEEAARTERVINIGKIGLIGICILLILVGYYYLRSRRKRKIIEGKRKEIIVKKREVEQKHKSFIRNFEYAKSIQEAVLPGNNLEKALPDSFVYYKPKDIVSGDFYWVSKTVENKVLIAVGDCTGHGVPGALMSIMGTAFINEVVSENPNVSPAKLLEELRDRVISGLQQKGKEGEARDGMDISICLIDTKDLRLSFSGAFNPMYMVRDKDLTIIDADAQPIGYYLEEEKPFTEKHFDLQKGDVMYLTTDGYQDQFGGPKGKKFMKKKLKEMLIDISHMSLNEQKIHIDNKLQNWMADEFQVDDICVLGFRV